MHVDGHESCLRTLVDLRPLRRALPLRPLLSKRGTRTVYDDGDFGGCVIVKIAGGVQ